MNTDEDRLKENHSDNARFLRRRRAASLRQLEATTATSQGEEQDQEQLQKKVQWEELHCRASTTSNNNSGYGGYGPGWEPVVSEYLPEQGDLSSPESIATSTALLHPTLSVVGTNFCAEGNETKFEFQHFRYQAIPFHQQQPPQGWYVNCCDLPQQLDINYYLDSPISQTVSPDDCPLVIPDITPYTQNRVNAQIVVSCVAAFLSLSTILAMTLPLLKKRRRKKASTYNLYLVFLSVPDLIYNIFLVWLFVEFDRLTCARGATGMPRIDHPWDLALFVGIAVASLYINATIAFEILKLLRNSKKRKRSKAPSLKKALIQAGCFYMLGLTMGYVDYFGGDYLKDNWPKWVIVLFLWNLAVGFPIFYMIYVCIQIWREQLLGERGTKAGKRLSVLVWYFARLVFVYIGIFLPASILYSLQWESGVYYWWGCLLYSLQVWVSFTFALTKPDVRKNVIDLYTFKACRPDPDDPKKKKQATMNFLVNTKPKTTSTPKSREKQHTTSTGYDSVEIIKDPANGHVDQDPSTSTAKEVDGKGKISFKNLIMGMSSRDVNVKVKAKEKEYSDASDGYNSNVFKFDVADAPIVHTIGSDHRVHRSGSIFFGGSKRAQARRNSSAELRQTAKQARHTIATSRVRSSITEQSREKQSLSASEPLDLRTIKFDDETDRGPVAGASAIIQNHRESKNTETFNFFMDRNSIYDSSNLNDPKKRRRWKSGLRKNIHDLGRMLHKTDVTEEEKKVYRQSIYLTKKALEVALSLGALNEKRSSSLGSDVTKSSGGSEASVNVEETGENSTNNPSSQFVRLSSKLSSDEDFSASSTTSFGSDDNETTVVDGDGDGDGDADNNSEGEWLFSKDHWLTELRRNIDDLSIRLENEHLTEDERAMVSRAIESQLATLSSIESLVGGDIDAVLSSSRNKRSNKNSNTVDHSNNSAFVHSSLEVIDDNSYTDTAD